MGRSTQFYRDNPEARRKKNAYQKRYNAKPSARKRRAESNRARYRMKKNGVDVDGKDVAHTKNGFRVKSVKANRGSKSDSPGDRRARARGRKRRK